MSEPAEQHDAHDALHPPARKPVKTWSSAEIFGEGHEAHIEHAGEVYRLLRTRNNKLILVK